MKIAEPFREMLLRLISENPGLHFRELQRRTDSAVGKLDYHLYQLERGGRIISRKDAGNVRYFSSESGTISDRRIAFYLRNKTGRELLLKALSNKNGFSGLSFSEKENAMIRQMEKDGIIVVDGEGNRIRIEVRNRNELISFLKRYGQSFVDSIALSILGLIDED